MKSFTIILVPLAFSVIMAGQLLAQGNNNEKGDVNKESKTVSVTGCLGQSDAPGTPKQYIIKSADMTYELEPGSENLNAHLGHKVTVSGTSMKGKGPHDDDRIRITKLTMVSAMCP
jgi:hypothetical protein